MCRRPTGLPPGSPARIHRHPARPRSPASYDGTGFLNSELLFKGSNATVTFTTAGTFGFICQIHPGMSGTVNVVASGATTTQADADAKAALTRTAILGAVDSLEAATNAQVTETERSDGTSLWNIFTNSIQAPAPQPGGGTGFLELLRFVPPSLEIQAGDTVRWTATAVHTVTFPADGQDPATIDPFTTPPTTGTVYDGTSLYNSALLSTGAPGTGSTVRADIPRCGDVQLRVRPAPVPGADGHDRRVGGTGGDATADRHRSITRVVARRGDPMGRHRVHDPAGHDERRRTAGHPPPLIGRKHDDRVGFGSPGRLCFQAVRGSVDRERRRHLRVDDAAEAIRARTEEPAPRTWSRRRQ